MFAEGTTVAAEKTRGEIERLLGKHGAEDFAYTTNAARAAIAFRMKGRSIRMIVPFPGRDEIQTAFKPKRYPYRLTEVQILDRLDQVKRSRWRALLLTVKAKLEAIASGIVTFEHEFLAHTIVPGTGRTVAEEVADQLVAAYENPGAQRGLLLGMGDG